MRGRSMSCWVMLMGVALVAAGTSAWPEVALNGMFGDNMVLQREMQVPIWGTAAPGEQVTVTACGQTKTTTAGTDGKWMVRLDPIETAASFTVTVTGENQIVLENVIMGDVWICSGQSNMVWPVGKSNNASEEIATADYPLIRLCQVKRATSPEPTDYIEAPWQPCSPQTVSGFSAIGFFFGREIHEQIGVPIGLISTNWGGTPVEAWTSREKLETIKGFEPVFERWQRYIEAYPAAMEKYRNETLPAWQRQVEEARAAGKQPPRRPYPPLGPDAPQRPSNLFNAMIYPMIPYAIKGVIWYQGEANARTGAQGAWMYRKLFPAMIEDWRERWGQGDFPFGWIQLANYRATPEQPGPSAWAELRESQTLTLSLPNTGQALAIDSGEAGNIHPRDKQTPAHRLALWARARVYGERDLPYSGPMYESMQVEGRYIRLRFRHVYGRLRRMVTENAPYPSPLQGFQIAGADRRWVWAQARIERDIIVVWSDEVAHPVAVRYGWADNPIANLYNLAGLPAVPFRTDRWRLSTQPDL